MTDTLQNAFLAGYRRGLSDALEPEDWLAAAALGIVEDETDLEACAAFESADADEVDGADDLARADIDDVE